MKKLEPKPLEPFLYGPVRPCDYDEAVKYLKGEWKPKEESSDTSDKINPPFPIDRREGS